MRLWALWLARDLLLHRSLTLWFILHFWYVHETKYTYLICSICSWYLWTCWHQLQHNDHKGIAREAEWSWKIISHKDVGPLGDRRSEAIRGSALCIIKDELDEYAAAAATAADLSSEPFVVWQRNMIAVIEGGYPNWYDMWKRSILFVACHTDKISGSFVWCEEC